MINKGIRKKVSTANKRFLTWQLKGSMADLDLEKPITCPIGSAIAKAISKGKILMSKDIKENGIKWKKNVLFKNI